MSLYYKSLWNWSIISLFGSSGQSLSYCSVFRFSLFSDSEIKSIKIHLERFAISLESEVQRPCGGFSRESLRSCSEFFFLSGIWRRRGEKERTTFSLSSFCFSYSYFHVCTSTLNSAPILSPTWHRFENDFWFWLLSNAPVELHPFTQYNVMCTDLQLLYSQWHMKRATKNHYRPDTTSSKNSVL